jgi:hypothetical protein
LVEGLLQLMATGDDAVAAEQVIQWYPEAGGAAGAVLTEVGGIMPSGVIGLLAAVNDLIGYDQAFLYIQSISQRDPTLAACIADDPRLQPPPPVTESHTAPELSIRYKDPADLNGKRWAVMVDRGHSSQVVADIVRESQRGVDQPNDAFSPKANRAAAKLVMDVVRNASDNPGRTLGTLLGRFVAEDHAWTAARALTRVARDDARVLPSAIDAMSSSALQEMLDLLAHGHDPRLPALLGQMPPRVTAHLFLKWEQEHPEALPGDLAEVRSPSEVLRQMAELNLPLAASFMSRIIDPPEEITDIALDLVSNDLSITTQLLNRVAVVAQTEALMLIASMILSTKDVQVIGLSAGLLAAMIRHEPDRVPHQIAQLVRVNGHPDSASDEDRGLWLIANSREPDNLNRLLDRLMEKNPDEGRQVVSSMVEADVTYCKRLLPVLIKRHNLVFTCELLLQLANHEPDGPWAGIANVVSDGNFKVAIDIAEKAPL